MNILHSFYNLPIDEHFDYLKFEAIVKKTANIHIQVLVKTVFSFLVDKYTPARLLGCGSVCFALLETSNVFSNVCVIWCMRVPAAPHPQPNLTLSATLVHVQQHLNAVLIYISQICKHYLCYTPFHIHIDLTVIHILSLVEPLFKAAYLLSRFFVCFSWAVRVL